MSLIILEGLDGTGKSALAEKLSEHLGWPIVNLFDKYDKEFLESIEINVETYHEDLYFMDVWKQVGFNCIKDRGLISGWVYENDNFVNAKEAMGFWFNEMKENKEEIYFIFLDARNDTIVERDSEWEGKEEELNQHRDYFRIIRKALKQNGFNVIQLSTDKKNEKETFKEVVECLNL